MRTFTRVIFGFNAIYQGLVGLLCLFVPLTALSLYSAPEGASAMPFLIGAFRMTGAFIVVGGCISVLIARNPDQHPILLPVMGLLAITTLVAEGLMLVNGEGDLSQLGLDMIVQAAILAAAFGYTPAARASASPAAV